MTTIPPYTLLAAFMLILAACTPQSITVSPQPERNVLTVSGEGQLEINPDKVEITIAIVTNSSTAMDAQAKNRALSNSIIQALKNSGVKSEEIETIEYDLHQLYGYREKTGERTDQGYELSHRMKITSINVDGSGALVDLAISSGANRIEAISFGLTRELERQAKTEALARAAKEATYKAQAVAANIGATMGKVVRASESASYTPYYPPFMAMRAADLGEAAPAPTVVSPQKLTITATVNLDYEIR